jgi:hypothetical protein
MNWYFNNGKKLNDFNELYVMYNEKEFNSPKRSTLYLLSFVQSELFINLLKRLDLNIECINNYFEYDVISPKGKGNSSFTDLMIIDNNKSIAIEAKYTEPEYEKINEWLNSENRKLVLNGWLEIINRKINLNIVIENIKNITYQMVHRLASACYNYDKISEMIYLYFGNDINMENYYKRELNNLKKIVKDKIKILFIQIIPNKSDLLLQLEKEWNSKDGRMNIKNKILNGLMENILLDFRKSEIKIY